MQRRAFITLFAGAAAARSLTVRAQQTERMRRVGVLMSIAADDPEAQARVIAFAQGLKKLGWTEGSNVQIDTRWATDADLDRQYSAELVALAPDVLLAAASPSVAALQRVTRNVPIVFVTVIDPVGAGFVASMARPGGTTTGFSAFEYSVSAKWIELLKEIAPNVTRAAVLRDPALSAGIGQFAAIEALAPPSFGVELSPIDVRDPGEIERAITAFASTPNGGLIVTASSQASTHRDLIISLATRYRLPNVYPFREWGPCFLRAECDRRLPARRRLRRSNPQR
jgi:putative ABC transport system substrate-binding protein